MPSREELKLLQALPLELKVEKTKARIREWVNYYGTDGVYVSFSGGKDSTVLLHIVRSIYPDIEAVFVNTGLEYPEIQKFVKTFDNVTINFCKSSDCSEGSPVAGGCSRCNCVAFYNAGYRKAGENEVIISKEELKRREKNYKIGLGKSQSWVKKLKNDKEQLESDNFNLLRTIDTIREEMAEEIYKEARERVNEGIEWLNCSKDKPGKEYMKGVTFGLSLFNKALVNTIKKYGVEVLNEQEAKN